MARSGSSSNKLVHTTYAASFSRFLHELWGALTQCADQGGNANVSAAICHDFFLSNTSTYLPLFQVSRASTPKYTAIAKYPVKIAMVVPMTTKADCRSLESFVSSTINIATPGEMKITPIANTLHHASKRYA
jgi:hypothetical protein